MSNVNVRINKAHAADLFIDRWSPYAFSGEAVDQKIVDKLFEAARWAPSSYNNQSWRFIYAHRDTQHWNQLFNLLVEFNQSWVKNTGLLVVLVSKKNFDHNGKPSRTHSFDAGAAWMSVALQASLIPGLAAHGMEGFDYEKARDVCGVPEGFAVEMMFAVGYVADKSVLPKELQERETPSQRKELSELVFEGRMS